MDTTKQNILMLEKAWEIQKEWNPLAGDYFYEKRSSDILVVEHYNNVTTRITVCGCLSLAYVLRDANLIWLPTQSQLQRMLPEMKTPLTYITLIYQSLDEEKDYLIGFNSWEQLWLAIVMKMKFGKFLVREDWIKGRVE